MEVVMGKEMKRRAKGTGRVYKDKGVYFLQYTDKEHRRKAMILRDKHGEKITELRKAEAVAKEIVEKMKQLKEIESREEYLEEKARLKKLKARLTISLDDAFELSQAKPHSRVPSEKVLRVSRRYWYDFVCYLKDQYKLTTLDEVERSHAEAYIAYIRAHGRWNPKISYSKERCTKRKKFKSYDFGGNLSNTTLNRYQSVCKAVFTFLLPDLGYSLEENPFYYIKPLKLAPIDREIFSPDELQLIFRNPTPLMLGLFTTGICTGLRLGDVATLKWKEIEGYEPNLLQPDFCGKEIIRLTRKTKAVVHIPIQEELANYLHKQYWESGQEEYILPEAARMYLNHQNVLNSRVLGYLHSLGIKTQREVPDRKRKQSVKDFHSLRHCFCYYAGMRNVPLPVVQSIVGHLTQSMTRHYQSHADKQARMEGVALMHGLTSGEVESKAEKRFDSLVRKGLTEYIQGASEMAVAKLNLIVVKLKKEEYQQQEIAASTIDAKLLA
jgi:integrase